MDWATFWRSIDDAWLGVDGSGELRKDLLAPGWVEPARLEPALDACMPALKRFAAALSPTEARGWIHRYREAATELQAREPVGKAAEFVVVLGEAYHRAVREDVALIDHVQFIDDYRLHSMTSAFLENWSPAIVASIREAFADVAHPGNEAVYTADWGGDENSRFYYDKDWRQLDGRDLEIRSADLSFFKPEGVRYLLPAFMIASLEGNDGANSHAHHILGKFTVRRRVSEDDGVLLASLTSAQRRAIAEFLSFMYDWTFGWSYTGGREDLVQALERLGQLALRDAFDRSPH